MTIPENTVIYLLLSEEPNERIRQTNEFLCKYVRTYWNYPIYSKGVVNRYIVVWKGYFDTHIEFRENLNIFDELNYKLIQAQVQSLGEL